MATYKKKRPIRKPSHPGEVLKSLWLDELGYTQAEFAQMLVDQTGDRIKLSTMKTKLSEMIKGKRAMTAEFAVLVSQVLDTSPKMWMSMQTNLDIWVAEESSDVA